MNYEIDKMENDLKNMYIVFNPKKLDNIKVINDIGDLIIEDLEINELYKKLIICNNINE